MLFNSIPFLAFFLPLSLFLFFFLGRRNGQAGKTALALMSFAFYAYWDYRFLPLLCASICVNFLLGGAISARAASAHTTAARHVLVGGLVFNLTLLAFFKYANLFVSTGNSLGAHWLMPHIILPIGISFFTFTQIAFLVDAYQGKAREARFWDYALFVSYFPHQIAGPILHHKEMMSQFRSMQRTVWSSTAFTVGLSILAFGLVKKILLADTLADLATPVFSSAEGGGHLQFFEAWMGALAYALQLYFDFSSYCDMAIGISLMFGIRLPINFNSPYKSLSMIDFWQRWHMTLSRFLRDYLYIPLGGNRRGPARRYVNLLATMGLGGLWHGAAWTFLVWGLLHGVYLVINHLWRERVAFAPQGRLARPAWSLACWALTFLAVLLAWVFFRAQSFAGALRMLDAMIGLNGVALPPALGALTHLPGVYGDAGWLGTLNGLLPCAFILLMLLVCLGTPNAQQIFAQYQPVLPDARIEPLAGTLPVGALAGWRPTLRWAVPLAAVTGIALSRLGGASEFLYFNF